MTNRHVSFYGERRNGQHGSVRRRLGEKSSDYAKRLSEHVRKPKK